jgi:hypothetical protein
VPTEGDEDVRTIHQIAKDIRGESGGSLLSAKLVIHCAAAIVHAIERCESQLKSIEASLRKGGERG